MRARQLAAALCAAALAGGCSLVFPVDAGDIMTPPDGGMADSGMDAGVDGGPLPDAGPDAGFDGGNDAGPFCMARQAREVSCQDGVDNDCANGIDCADPACMGTAACCDSEALFTNVGLLAYDTAWTRGPSPFGPGTVLSNSITFETSTPTNLFNPECLALASGARFEARFDVGTGGAGDDFASLVFTSSTPPPESPVPVDLAVRFSNDGRIRVLRAERELASLDTSTLGSGPRNLFVNLTPGVDEFGAGTLEATIRVIVGAQSFVLMNKVAFMPLEDLIGDGLGCSVADGLHVGFEGANSAVTVTDRLRYSVGECSTPRQFFPLSSPPDFDTYVPAGPFPGGSLGEPALSHVLTGGNDRFELWLDVASGVRSEEDFAPFPLALLGGFDIEAFGADPRHRTPDAIVGPTPPSREPSLLMPRDETGALEGTVAFFAYSQEVVAATPGVPAQYGIQVGQIGLTEAAVPSASLVLNPVARTSCYSYRDPSLVRVTGTSEFLLFYTCEHDSDAGDGRDTIGVAQVTFDAVSWALGMSEDRLLAAVPGYASRGVFSPEAILEARPTEVDAPTHLLRVWYLTRSPAGIQVALAEGAIFAGDELPSLNPVAANPILGPTSPELGPASCDLGCFIQSVGVSETVVGATPVFSDPRLSEPHYLILVDRARHEPGEVVTHELIPLLQTRANL